MPAESPAAGQTTPHRSTDTTETAERRTGAENYMCQCGHLSHQHTYCKYECKTPGGCDCQEYAVQR